MRIQTLIKTVAAVGALALASAAQAVSFNFTVDGLGGTGMGPVPYGSVDLTQSGSDVNFTVTLFNSLKFVNTGSHTQFAFNGATAGYIDNATIRFNGVLNANFTGITSAPESNSNIFNFGIDCTGTCSNGGANAIAGPLTFTFRNALVSNFGMPNGSGATHATSYWFGADVYCASCTPGTGAIYVNGPTTTVPEPATLGLLGLGLAAVGIARRRKVAA